ncbi:MAG: hypothetical protein FJY38_07585 [Betaproteobacteria bacterium]|nr:hypothetical protein [Betaproteobacteria bacterium]
MGREPQALEVGARSIWGLARPDYPLRWATGFGLLFIALFWMNSLVAEQLAVVPDRIAAVFLPAFARVVALLVAGAAGAAGIFLGSFLCGVLITGDAWHISMAHAFLSIAGVWTAVCFSQWAFRQKPLELNWASLAAVGVLSSILNAMVHGVFWASSFGEVRHIQELAWMVWGDFTGILIGFLVLRVCLRLLRRGYSLWSRGESTQ